MLINIHDAKTHFSKIIQQALKGEEVIIAKGGTPMVKLIPYAHKTEERQGGQLRGMITINKDFNDDLPDEILKMFYDGGVE